MKNYLLFSALVILSIFSCSKDKSVTLDSGDYLIFGQFNGECIGSECVRIYELTNAELYADTLKNYPGSGPYDFIELEQNLYDQVKDLPESFPMELLSDPNVTFGCPDCYDQGGIYVELKDEGVTSHWVIDTNKDDVPEYIHAFHDQVMDKVLIINE